jgi:hypothetical protein
MKALVRCALLASAVTVVLALQGGGPASDLLGVAVANAATSCPGGFTVTVQGLPAGSQPTSSLTQTTPGASSCVLSLGIPAGAAGAQGSTGGSGVSGYSEATSHVSSKGNSLDATANCPAGTKAMGGGPTITPGKGKLFAITSSGPTPGGGGWMVGSINLNSSRSNIYGPRSNSINLNSSRSNIYLTVICAAVSPST